jgi:hypothetical protein
MIERCAFCPSTKNLDFVIKGTGVKVCAICSRGRVQHLTAVKQKVTAIAEGKEDAKK